MYQFSRLRLSVRRGSTRIAGLLIVCPESSGLSGHLTKTGARPLYASVGGGSAYYDLSVDRRLHAPASWVHALLPSASWISSLVFSKEFRIVIRPVASVRASLGAGVLQACIERRGPDLVRIHIDSSLVRMH